MTTQNETKRSAVQHTPGPWKTAKDRKGRAMVVMDDGGQQAPVAQPDGESYAEAMANAEFIVRACNSHDAMLEALMACFVNGDPADGFDPENALTERMVRAAIAKAEGRAG